MFGNGMRGPENDPHMEPHRGNDHMHQGPEHHRVGIHFGVHVGGRPPRGRVYYGYEHPASGGSALVGIIVFLIVAAIMFGLFFYFTGNM